jgi:Flp pilus assembly protein TadG
VAVLTSLSAKRGQALRETGVHGKSAQALTEFALILPVLVLLFLGSIDLTRAFYYYIVLQNATREAARTAIDFPNQYTDTYICAAAAREAGSLVTLSCSSTPATIVISPAANASGTPPSRESGRSPITVTASTSFSPVTIFIQFWTGTSITIKASTTMLTYY